MTKTQISLVKIYTLTDLILYEYWLTFKDQNGIIKNHANKIKQSCEGIQSVISSNGIKAKPATQEHNVELWETIDFVLHLSREQLIDFNEGLKNLTIEK